MKYPVYNIWSVNSIRFMTPRRLWLYREWKAWSSDLDSGNCLRSDSGFPGLGSHQLSIWKMALLQIAECTAVNQDSGKQGERNSHWLKYDGVDHISETSLTGLVSGMAGSRYFRIIIRIIIIIEFLYSYLSLFWDDNNALFIVSTSGCSWCNCWDA